MKTQCLYNEHIICGYLEPVGGDITTYACLHCPHCSSVPDEQPAAPRSKYGALILVICGIVLFFLALGVIVKWLRP